MELMQYRVDREFARVLDMGQLRVRKEVVRHHAVLGPQLHGAIEPVLVLGAQRCYFQRRWALGLLD